jgi:CubicO group peptidase (beta-lactamase class C family)
MKTFFLFLTMLLSAQFLFAQKELLDAIASDPLAMGWMQGFRPTDDKIVSATDGSFFSFPAMRYSVCNMRQFMPTVNVPSAQNNRYVFQTNIDKGIDKIVFRPWGDEKKMNWEESLTENYTDGILILHKGQIVYEKYFGALKPDGEHAVMSVSKTFTGTLGALLVVEGILDENKTAAEYVPELKHSAFGDATIRQILDMTTALQYSEDYSDPNAEVWTFSNSKYYYDYLVTVKKNGEQGKAFGYKTINTDAMGWIISRVTGKSIPQLLSERIWKPMGANFDGYYSVDHAGIAFAGGGFNANLRDLAMFGEMIRNKGYFNGQQVLPKSLIANIEEGGSRKAFKKAGYQDLKDWSYRNMWWMTHNEHRAFAARGVHGQTIYIDPTAEMVIVRLASHPEAKNAKIDPTSLPAYHAVAKYLINNK